MKSMHVFLIVAVAALASACSGTSVTFLTTVIPGRVAAVDIDKHVVTLGRGAVIAFECTEFDDIYSGPCRSFSAVVDDDTIAAALPAHLDQLAGAAGTPPTIRGDAVSAPEPRTGSVIVAHSAGTTALTVTSKTGTVDLTVNIVDP